MVLNKGNYCHLKIFYLAASFSFFANQVCFVECSTISTEKSLEEQFTSLASMSSSSESESAESDEGEERGATCENELSLVFCESVVDSDSCPGLFEDSPLKTGCRKSCGFCGSEKESKETLNEMEVDDDALNGGCEDKIPNCSSYLSLCCSMKEAMNSSCPKTCKFCSETPVPPSAPGGIAAPTAATGQDPCSPTDPPSVTVDAPGAPGQTTTTQSPIGTVPGVSIDNSIPGQTTTTTQASLTSPGNLPGVG